MKKVYIACALTQAPPKFEKAVEAFKRQLRKKFPLVAFFNFVGLEKGTPRDVYQWDIGHCVKDCDLLIAICDYPAIGLGYELGVAIEKWHKYVLAVANEESKLTRLLLGISDPRFELVRYRNLSDLIPLIAKKLG